MDKFRINWIEKNGNQEIICVSGFEYQVDNWSRDFINDQKKINYNVIRKTKISNSDGTVTATFVKTKGD